jgi:hypothetical protein
MNLSQKRLNLMGILRGAMISIRKIELPLPGLECLRSEARDEGYDFIETLVEEWASASNRFDAPGEALCGHLAQGPYPPGLRQSRMAQPGNWESADGRPHRQGRHPLPVCTLTR